jgi:3-oxoacyl-[acyl-carrier protein] reductase
MEVIKMSISGKIAIVTGAARGIGAAIAEYLSSEGASLVIADINGHAAELMADKLKSFGKKAIAIQVDVSKEDSVLSMVNKTVEEFGQIDILVNNAGVLNSDPVPELKLADWDRVLDINLKGTFLCSKAVIEIMIKNRKGKIINISSLAGQVGGLKASPAYAASKAGIICLTKSFARYGAKYGINVNTVCPGFIETDMTKGRDDPNSVPLGRLGTCEDVAKAVYFLASHLSDYITGTTIDVNGGLLLR